jgi:predicted nucleic acid-binding protein
LTTFVLDASVAAKWCLPSTEESFVPQAQRLLESYSRGEIRFMVPDLFWAELGNVMWKAVRSGRISPANALLALGLVNDLSIPVFASADLLPEALRIALAHQRTVYDCLYVALAVQSAVQLITADDRLANALAAHLPVKWLGSL